MGNRIKTYLKRQKEFEDAQVAIGGGTGFAGLRPENKPISKVVPDTAPATDEYSSIADQVEAGLSKQAAPQEPQKETVEQPTPIAIPGLSSDELRKQQLGIKTNYVNKMEDLDRKEMIEKVINAVAQIGAGAAGLKSGLDLGDLKLTTTDWERRRDRAQKLWALTNDKVEAAMAARDRMEYRNALAQREALAKHAILREKEVLKRSATESDDGRKKLELFNKMVGNAFDLDRISELPSKKQAAAKQKLVAEIRVQASELGIPAGVVQNALVDPEGSGMLWWKSVGDREGKEVAGMLKDAVKQAPEQQSPSNEQQQIKILIDALRNPNTPPEKKAQYKQLLQKRGYIK